MISRFIIVVLLATFSQFAFSQNWHKQYHSSNDFRVQNEAIHVLSDGSAIVSGQFMELHKVDASGNFLWKRNYQEDEMVKIWEFQAHTGDTLLAWGSRTKTIYADFEYDYISQGILLKMDTSGNILDRVVYDLEELGYSEDIDIKAPADDYAGFIKLNDSTLIGSFAVEDGRCALFCLNTDGSLRWHKKVTQQILEIIPDGTGNIIAGSTLNVYRINATTGDFFWKIQQELSPTNVVISGSLGHKYIKRLFQTDESTFVGVASQSLFEISIDGEWIWEQEIQSGYQMDAEIIDDHILTTSDEWLFEYDLTGERTDSLLIDRVTRQMELHPDGILVAGTHSWSEGYGLNLYKLDWPATSTPTADSIALQELPDGPSTVNITISENQIQVTWTDPSEDEDYFILQRSVGDKYNFENYTSLPANSTSFTDTEVDIAVDYYYRVKTTNQWGQKISGFKIGTIPPPLPTTPTDFEIAETGNDFFRLSWQDQAQYEKGFKLLRASYLDASYTQIADVPANTQTYLDESVSGDIRYYYKLFAYNNTGNSDTLKLDTIVLSPLVTISNFSIETTSHSELVLEWESVNAYKDGYRVYRSASASGEFEMLAEIEASENTYTDSDLESETEYFYKITVYRGEESATSDTKSAITYPLPPPSPDFIYAYDLTPDSVSLKWHPVERAAAYVMEKRISLSEDEFELVRTTSDTFLIDRSVDWGVVYNYRIKATNSGGESDYYDELGVDVPYPMPEAPDQFTATATSDTSIILNWQDNSDVERGFWIYRSLNSSTGFQIYKGLPANTTSFEDTNLESSTTYYYRLQAHNNTRGTSSIYANATTLQSPPIAPASLRAIAITSNSIQLEWNDLSDNEDQFTVRRSVGNKNNFQDKAATSANTHSFLDSGLKENTSYYYVALATNSGGFTHSDTLGVTTPKSRPLAPTDLSGSLVNDSVFLSWTDNSFNETDYLLTRVTANDTTNISLPSNTTNYLDPETIAGKDNLYWVQAVNETGISDTAQFTIFIPTLLNKVVSIPDILLFPNPFDDQLQITWDLKDIDYIELISIQGQVSIFQPKENTISVNTTNLAEGVYIIQIHLANGQAYSMKAVKK